MMLLQVPRTVTITTTTTLGFLRFHAFIFLFPDLRPTATTVGPQCGCETDHWRPPLQTHHADTPGHTPLIACAPAHNVQNCADGFRLRSWPMSGIHLCFGPLGCWTFTLTFS